MLSTTDLKSIQALGGEWHGAGTLPNEVLEEITRLGQAQKWERTLETGCGRSTLALSHLSAQHLVFTCKSHGTEAKDDDSYTRVISSPLLNAASTQFVLGPTQKTLPRHEFTAPFDFILLDGPHSYPFPELEYYFVYPHLKPGGYLIIDDIWIPSLYNMYALLREDPMFCVHKVVANTAFLMRTDAPTFDPFGDDWMAQPYNTKRFPVAHTPPSLWSREGVKKVLGVSALPPAVRGTLKQALSPAARPWVAGSVALLGAAGLLGWKRRR